MNDNYYMDILIPFDLLVDTDIGVLKVIERDYNDDRYFNIDRIKDNDYNDLDDNTFYFLLTYRNYINPLYLITDEKMLSKEDIDDLYNQLLKEKYIDILQLSKTTAIYNIFHYGMMHNENPFKLTVLCKNELDVEYLKEINFKCKTIIINNKNDLYKLNMNEYEHIYVKNIEDLSYFNKMEMKNIYIANYRFNTKYTENPETKDGMYTLKLEFIFDIIPDNKIKIIDIYAIDESMINF